MVAASRRIPDPAKMAPASEPSAGPPGGGFTLIEILIVISIIAVVAGLVMVGIQVARDRVNVGAATMMIQTIAGAVENYYQDESVYPGMELAPNPNENHFPVLYNALLGEPKPRGPGGRSAPYLTVKDEQIVVWDPDAEMYRQATREEVRDPRREKYILDPWGNPYVYRCNKGKKLESYMHNQTFDIYSWGRNGEDDTILGDEDGGKSDDIGNW